MTWIFSLVQFAFLLRYVDGSHFRGSIITWKPIAGSTFTAEFSYKIAWRRSYNSATGCTVQDIQQQTVLPGLGSWTCTAGCLSTTPQKASFVCTDYSEVEDWTQGEYTFQLSFHNPGPFVISHTGCCWIGSLAVGGGSRWDVSTTADLNPRPDNGLINSSPVSATSPILRLVNGCRYNIPIHVDDPDGDEVRCRFAQGTNECSGVCNALPGAHVVAKPCSIEYTTTSAGWFAVALMIEDFTSSSSTTPLSKVPLQFLIHVQNGNEGSCGTPLSFSESTIKGEQACIAIPPSGTFTTTIEVIETTTSRLVEVNLVAPPGLVRSPVQQIGSNRGITITWTPSTSQYGQHVFCFLAVDQNGFTTDQRCVTILAGASTPDLVPNSLTPIGADIPITQRIFQATFDQEIHRPSVRRSIKIMSTLYDPPQAVVELDASTAAEVSVKDNTLTFYLPEWFDLLDEGARHYVQMDPGTVVGVMSCSGGGAPFRGISDPNEWSFDTVIPDRDPCKKNGGKGDCEYQCVSFENVLYQCWCDNNANFVLGADGHSCVHLDLIDSCPCVNGACRGGGACECFIGWEGETCATPSCRFQNDCSKNGDCIAPGVCACKPGWGGPACNVDFCSRYGSCRSCTRHTGCGWCDESKRCSAGSGYGPTRSSCQSWFYYYCHAIADDDAAPQSCSLQVSHAQCRDDCLDNSFLRTRGPGSYEYCKKYVDACKRYAKCYAKTPSCLQWYEEDCRFGLIGESPRSRRSLGSPEENIHSDVLEPQDFGVFVAKEVVRRIQESGIFPDDRGLLLRIGWVESRYGREAGTFHADDTPVGIWKMDKDALERTQNVNDYPQLQEKHEKIQTIFGINWNAIKMLDLHKPLIAGLAARLFLSTIKTPIPKEIQKQAEYWKNNYNKDESKSVETFLNKIQSIPRRESQEPGLSCVNGIYVRETESCLCEPDYTGTLCDQLNCGCSGSRQCQGRGVCVRSGGPLSKPVCRCNNPWMGACCAIPPRRTIRGDPHLETIDGFAFDYFGIGEFVACYSIPNDFGVQLRFFKYKNTSMIGAAAIKIGKGVATILAISSTQGQVQLPVFRINGAITPIVVGTNHTLGNNSVVLVINPTTLAGGLAQLFFQFKNGATYTIDVRYSESVGGQFFDTSLGAPSSFTATTTGLCGNMDGDLNNDFLSSNGTLTKSADEFAESWRITHTSSATSGYMWSWEVSNFHMDDAMTSIYTDKNHVPVYVTDGLDPNSLKTAETKCMQLGLKGQLMQDCMLDLAVTEDNVFLEQHVFSRGKCPVDCSNHGECIKGKCQCTGLWTGESCNEGGCSSCPPNSKCLNGFCQCIFGFYEKKGQCIQAMCDDVRNCTKLSHGRCHAPNNCLCNPGFEGDDCGDISICDHDCSGHGSCTTDNRCICDPNWSGERCEVPACEDLQMCSGHGTCNENATCACDPGWYGSSCAIADCSGVDWCSSEGDCVGPNVCVCYAGFTGPDCSTELICPDVSNCSGNGVCVNSSKCLCYDGFTGTECETPICYGNCNGHGSCISAYLCKCEEGWIGADCSKPSCQQYKFCSGHGQCRSFDTCECDDYWSGDACDVPRCPSNGMPSVDCSGNGQCLGPNFCLCNETHYGDLCERQVAATIVQTPPNTLGLTADAAADFLENASVLVNKDVLLSCFADGQPTPSITISNNGNTLNSSTQGNHAFVLITDLKISDSGVYRCEANNTHRRDVREMYLLVMEPPAIVSSENETGRIEIGEDQKKFVEDTFTLHCNASGHPKPTVAWTLDGVSIQRASHASIELRESGRLLTVHNATVDHSGNYTCTATNVAGSAGLTSSIHVSPCRPSIVVDQAPKCAYTILLIEESNTIQNTKAALPYLASQLDRSLLEHGIGVRSGNYFSVIGFGTRHKARIIRLESEIIFTENQVTIAVDKLRKNGTYPDGYDAIYTALDQLPLTSDKVRDCPIHLLLVTSEPKSTVVKLSQKKLYRKICETRPVIINAIINIPLAVHSKDSQEFALGIDWRGFPYFGEGEGHKRLNIVNQTVIGLSSFGICTAFRQYGLLALLNNGSLWDIYYSFSYAKRLSLFSAIVNETVTSLQQFKPCVDCQCQKDKNGNLVKMCHTIKDTEICNCRMNNIPIQQCRQSLQRPCKTNTPMKAPPFFHSLARGCQNVW